MWSKLECRNSNAKISANYKKKSAVSGRKQRILWSCYPDLNWRPHPYQRRRNHFFAQKQREKQKIGVQSDFCGVKKSCKREAPAPCFFMLSDSPHHVPRGYARASFASRIQATQSPRGQCPRACQPIGGGLHGAEPTSNPALCQGHDNRPGFARGGPPRFRYQQLNLSSLKNSLRLVPK